MDLKGWQSVSFDSGLYSKAAIFNAAYIFLDRAYFYFDIKDGRYVVYIQAKDGKQETTERVVKDYCNQAANSQRFQENLKENNEVVKLIVQRAFFSANPALVEEAKEKEIEELVQELEAELDEEGLPVNRETGREDTDKAK